MSHIRTVGIIGAMSQEIEQLKNALTNLEAFSFGRLNVYQGQLHGLNVILSLSGIGKVNAAAATTLLIQKFQPDYIINTGSAGGLAAGLKIGDVIIGTQTAHHDVDVTAFGYEIGQVPQLPRFFHSDNQLVSLAEQAASSFNGRVSRGLIVSGDQFIHSQTRTDEIHQAFQDVAAVEMEAAAIAQTCHQFEIPFVVIRAVSDSADDEANISFDEFLQTAAIQSANMVDTLLKGISSITAN